MRTGRLLMLVAVAAMTSAVITIGVAVAAEPETLATSAGVALGAGPVTVTLAPATGKALSARVASAGEGRKVYLVAKGLGADEPPETIYQIYLGLPQGVAPDPAAIYYVGSLNFFNAVGVGRSDPRFLSFDVTALLKTLQSRNSLGDNTTVTIVPANTPRVSAKPVIGEVALVEQ